jgi:hypothetical protein
MSFENFINKLDIDDIIKKNLIRLFNVVQGKDKGIYKTMFLYKGGYRLIKSLSVSSTEDYKNLDKIEIHIDILIDLLSFTKEIIFKIKELPLLFDNIEIYKIVKVDNFFEKKIENKIINRLRDVSILDI